MSIKRYGPPVLPHTIIDTENVDLNPEPLTLYPRAAQVVEVSVPRVKRKHRIELDPYFRPVQNVESS